MRGMMYLRIGRTLYALACGAVALGSLFLTTPATGEGFKANGRGSGSGGAYADFPLWKDVPGRTFAVLGEGSLRNRTRWGVYASRASGSKRAYENPCVSVASITAFGVYGNAHRCGPLLPASEPSTEPAIYVAIGGSSSKSGETVMGLSFSPQVQKVVARFAAGGQITRRTKLLNARQRAKTHLPPLRYIALGLQRDVCVETVIGYDAAGSVILQAPTQSC